MSRASLAHRQQIRDQRLQISRRKSLRKILGHQAQTIHRHLIKGRLYECVGICDRFIDKTCRVGCLAMIFRRANNQFRVGRDVREVRGNALSPRRFDMTAGAFHVNK